MGNSEEVEKNDSGSLIRQLSKAIHEMEAQNGVSEDKVRWKEIEEHFLNLEVTLKKKFEELEAKENAYKDEEAKALAMLAGKETAVFSKEQDLLDRVQVLKDAAVAVIAEARAAHGPTFLEFTDDGDNKDSKVSRSLGTTISHVDDSPRKMGEIGGVAANVKPRLDLLKTCEQMDAKGLVKFMMENSKNVNAIRQELSIALESAIEPARLVLDSLEGFYPSVQNSEPLDKKDAALQGMRKSCITILEAMAALLARTGPGADHLLNPEIKQQTRAIAYHWKPKLANAGTDATNGNTLEAEAFLQLLSTFRIASEFDDEELCKLVLVVANRRQTPELCRSLGLRHKMPDLIPALVVNGKEIDAVHCIHAFQLTDRFPPVPILRSFLNERRKTWEGNGGCSSDAAISEDDANALELASLRAVIRCIEEYKLTSEYPLDPLQKRVAQLKRLKPDRKRPGDFGKPQQSKKSRANSGHNRARGDSASASAVRRQDPTTFVPRTPYTGIAYAHSGSNPYSYQVPGQSSYTRQATDPRIYYYAQDGRATANPYNAAGPSSYGSYLGSGVQPSQQPYM